ncbi:hypothetical protein HAX54_014965, partial [Datura stramonium]|nr:hypothetical protein [Datura stramonium]
IDSMDADLSLYWTKEWLPAEFVPMPVVPCKIEISRLLNGFLTWPPATPSETGNVPPEAATHAHLDKKTRLRWGMAADSPRQTSRLVSPTLIHCVSQPSGHAFIRFCTPSFPLRRRDALRGKHWAKMELTHHPYPRQPNPFIHYSNVIPDDSAGERTGNCRSMKKDQG